MALKSSVRDTAIVAAPSGASVVVVGAIGVDEPPEGTVVVSPGATVVVCPGAPVVVVPGDGTVVVWEPSVVVSGSTVLT